MRIIHINDKLEVSGGVEVYLSNIVYSLRTSGLNTEWVAIKVDRERVSIDSDNKSMMWEGCLATLKDSPLAGTDHVFHVHSLSEPSLLEGLFKLGPVVRKAGEPRMVCPGQGKFWTRSESVCSKPLGFHCFYHAYMRMLDMKRMLRAISIVKF